MQGDLRVRAMKSRLWGFHSCWSLPALTLWLCVIITHREAGVRQLLVRAECIPATGCTALAYYTTIYSQSSSIELLTNIFQVQYSDLLLYSQRSQFDIINGTNLYVPFDCTCTNGQLSHEFSYTVSDSRIHKEYFFVNRFFFFL